MKRMLRSLRLMSSPRLPGNRHTNRVRDVGQQTLLDERLMGDVALIHKRTSSTGLTRVVGIRSIECQSQALRPYGYSKRRPAH